MSIKSSETFSIHYNNPAVGENMRLDTLVFIQQ